MQRRTVLITGASSGLGYEAALKLARLGANVVIMGEREIARGMIETLGGANTSPPA